MQYVVLDEQGKPQSRLEASGLDEAARKWAAQNFNDAVIEQKLLEMKRFPLQDGAFLEPYILCPVGQEEACMQQLKAQFRTDVHMAPEPVTPREPQPIDTGTKD